MNEQRRKDLRSGPRNSLGKSRSWGDSGASRARQAAGRILWLTWNKLAGSYFFFNAARRW